MSSAKSMRLVRDWPGAIVPPSSASTLIVALAVSQTAPPQAMSVTSKAPASVNVCSGAAMVEVPPSPKAQIKDVALAESLMVVTVSGATPLAGAISKRAQAASGSTRSSWRRYTPVVARKALASTV